MTSRWGTLATAFRELASGRRTGPGASLLRCGLSAAEVPYAWYMRRRNGRYDRGANRVERVGVPVVSVGNITTGGTGKTPLVEWLARWFAARSVRVAIVSRGYGASAGRPNDEARQLAQTLPDVPQVQNANRAAAARETIEKHQAELILLDDGFQHRRLARDLDIVLLDALEPFGFGRLLPRGLLREPVTSLSRADIVCLSRADLVSESQREKIRKEVQIVAPNATWVELAHRPRALLPASGQEAPLESLTGRRVAAFCGIGNPAGFRGTLAACGYDVSAWREFPDHHPYSAADIASLTTWASKQKAEAIVCTHKDLVKVEREALGDVPLWALSIGVKVISGKDELESRLGNVPCLPG